jgi:hypothetical protein
MRWGSGSILGLGAAALALLLIAVVALRPSGSDIDSAAAQSSIVTKTSRESAAAPKPQQSSTPNPASAEVASSPAPAPNVADASPKQHLTSPIRLLATIEGKGEPIAGVRLSGPITADALDRWKVGQMENLPLVGTTGADGRAEITSVAPMGRKYGWSWSLFAEAPGHQSALVSFPMHQSTTGTPSGAPVDVFLELRPAGMASLEGLVMDELNAPIEGAVVLVGSNDKQFERRNRSLAPEDLRVEVAFSSIPVRTDQKGRFIIPNAPGEQEKIDLVASADGFAETAYTTTLDEETSLTIKLKWANAELLVRVESPDGELLPGATGAFRLEGVALEGRGLRLEVRPPSGFEAKVSPIWVEVRNHQLVPLVEIPLVRTTTQYGVLLASDETTPVADAKIWMGGSISSGRRDQRSDSSGRFLIEVIPGLEVTITGRHPEHGSGSLDYKAASEAGSVPETVSLILRENASISGRLTNSAGEPIEGHPVVLTVAQGSNSWMRVNSSNSSGHYSFSDVPSGKSMVGFKFNENYVGGDAARRHLYNVYQEPKGIELDLKPGEQRTGVDFVLEEALGVTGTVKDEAGNPVQNASLSLSTHTLARPSSTAMTNQLGEFHLRVERQPGELIPHLHVRPPSEAMLHETRIDDIAVSSTPLEIVLKKRSVRTLRVVYEDGRPVTRYRYRTVQWPRHRSDTPVQSVLVESPDGTTSPADATPVEAVELLDGGQLGLGGFAIWEGGNEAVLVVRPRASVYGRVELYPAGTALAGATISAGAQSHAAFDPPPVVSDALGNFRLDGIIARLSLIRATDLICFSFTTRTSSSRPALMAASRDGCFQSRFVGKLMM